MPALPLFLDETEEIACPDWIELLAKGIASIVSGNEQKVRAPTGLGRQAASRLVVVILALVFAVFAVEFAQRAYLLLVRPPVVMTPDGEQWNPNGRGLWRGGWVTLDEFGFRNGLDSRAVKRNRRVLVVGDSVAFGMGVNDDQVFTHLLNQNLESAGVGFVNLGRPGLDTPELRDVLFSSAKNFLPVEGVLWVYYINDAKTSTRYVPSEQQKEYGRLREVEWAMYSVLHWPFQFKPLVIANLSSHTEDPRRTSWDEYYRWSLESYAPGSETRRNEELYLRDVVQWSRNRRIKLWVMIAPVVNQFTDRRTEPEDFVKAIMASENVPVLDLLPILSAANPERSVYLPGDAGHWSAWGHLVVARAVKEWLASDNLFSPGQASTH